MRSVFLAALLVLLPISVHAETFEVKMLNGNATGGMAFEPDFLSLKPGDTVKFLATQRGHNAATIKDFLPEGATPFKGKINQEIEITFTEEGFYGIMCTPHYDMGMVMVVRVGDAPLSEMKLPGDVRPGAVKRIGQIVERNR
ncbi:pseudoazurin [Aliirhizobium terrae]|uniref:pseudoazurin n=1 Tax=Terrirhizobium terrae TaxID=2926709 RepID=UPI00257913D0|nr:pseudoazurin [Rhizobium sp. CC-CFT758]WJH41701.1 pseudoazurin [Rhizobium sp. CC-CFT758]